MKNNTAKYSKIPCLPMTPWLKAAPSLGSSRPDIVLHIPSRITYRVLSDIGGDCDTLSALINKQEKYMKRINPMTNKPFRCGDINPETNQVFRGYNKARTRKDGTYVEMWLCPESFDAIKTRMRERARVRRHKEAFKRTKTTQQLIDALEVPASKASSDDARLDALWSV